MAGRTDLEQLVYQLSADIRGLERANKRALANVGGTASKIEARYAQQSKTVSRSLERMAAVGATVGAALSAQQVLAYADSWTNGANALSAAGVSMARVAEVQGQLVDLANETRTSTEATIGLYTRLSIATAELGLSQSDTMRMTELLNKTFQASGASASEASSAALQLSQALASGVLQGDELRSLRENAPLLAKAIADAMGVGIGELKKLGAEGKITAAVVSGAILGAGDQIETRFAATSMTVGQALQVLNNQLGRYIGEADSGMSATQRAAQAIALLAMNLDKVIPALTVLAGLIGGRYAVAMAAAAVRTGLATIETIRYQAALITLQARQTGATTAQVALNAAMTANPIGLVIAAIAGLAVGIYLLNRRYSESVRLQREIDATATNAGTALDEYEEAATAAANATGKNAREARANAAAMRQEAIEAVRSAQALRERTAALAAQRRTEAQEAEARLFRSMSSGGKGAVEARGGQLALAQAAARTAERLAAAAEAEAQSAASRLAEIDAAARDGSFVRDRGGETGSGSAEEQRREAERIAARRAELDLEREIALARASGDEAALKAAEERVQLAELVKGYLDAGFSDTEARALALEQLALLNQAVVLTEEREAAELRLQKIKENGERQLEREAEHAQRLRDQLLDQLDLEAELARLSGDEGALRNVQRRIWLEERTNEILRLRKALTEDEARAQASAELGRLDDADAQGQFRDFIVSTGGDFGDMVEEAGDRFRRRALEGLADALWAIVSQAFSAARGAEGGAGWLDAASKVLGSLGRRQNGGSATAKRPIIVGEKRAEVFVPSVNGTVLPSVSALARQGGVAARPPVISQTLIAHLQGSVLAAGLVAELKAHGAQMAVAAAGEAYARAKEEIPAEMAVARRYSPR